MQVKRELFSSAIANPNDKKKKAAAPTRGLPPSFQFNLYMT